MLRMVFVPRSPVSLPDDEGGDFPDLFLGDGAELNSADFLCNTASAVPIRYDAERGELQLATSIVGMPPVFIYRSNDVTAVASDIHLLLTVPEVRLRFDPLSVVELGAVGHPVEHRTLFRDLMLAESGVTLALDSTTGRVHSSTTWQLPAQTTLPWPSFLEAQQEAFNAVMKRIDLSNAFLSLTAGLDTRTVFSTLASQQRLVPAATMSGPRMSVDALTARQLCSAYGIDHHLITFTSDFASRLPELVESASLLSGGLATLDQAPEVYLYRQLGDRFQSRLSGNLGNQVGRGGTEGVSVRGADLRILGTEFDAAIGAVQARTEHWLLSRLDATQRERIEFILKQETIFTLASNFSIGNHFAAQQTPYASRQLIETLALRQIEDATARHLTPLLWRARESLLPIETRSPERWVCRAMSRQLGLAPGRRCVGPRLCARWRNPGRDVRARQGIGQWHRGAAGAVARFP
jgi:hypothetical protein